MNGRNVVVGAAVAGGLWYVFKKPQPTTGEGTVPLQPAAMTQALKREIQKLKREQLYPGIDMLKDKVDAAALDMKAKFMPEKLTPLERARLAIEITARQAASAIEMGYSEVKKRVFD